MQRGLKIVEVESDELMKDQNIIKHKMIKMEERDRRKKNKLRKLSTRNIDH